MTTLEARKTLAVLERLLAAVEQHRRPLDGDELRVVRRLHQRRCSLRDLLAAREAERAKNVIDLALWRDGGRPAAAREPELGASAI
jgi:hypothetical protein